VQDIQDLQANASQEKPAKEFVDGLIAKKPRDTAPDWIKCNISIKRADLILWLEQKEGDWINLQVSEAKSGKWYAEVDNWQPKKDSSGKGPRGF
jgi:hypothetical protein